MAKAPKAQDASDTAIVKALADILDDAGLAEIEFENGTMSVRLSRVTGSAAPVGVVRSPRSPDRIGTPRSRAAVAGAGTGSTPWAAWTVPDPTSTPLA